MMRKKLASRRGETLTEVLVAVLIVALSAALLATMIAAAVNINTRANGVVEDFYVQLSAAEGGDAEPSPSIIVVDGNDVDVRVYSDGEDTLWAYERSVTP